MDSRGTQTDPEAITPPAYTELAAGNLFMDNEVHGVHAIAPIGQAEMEMEVDAEQADYDQENRDVYMYDIMEDITDRMSNMTINCDHDHGQNHQLTDGMAALTLDEGNPQVANADEDVHNQGNAEEPMPIMVHKEPQE